MRDKLIPQYYKWEAGRGLMVGPLVEGCSVEGPVLGGAVSSISVINAALS